MPALGGPGRLLKPIRFRALALAPQGRSIPRSTPNNRASGSLCAQSPCKRRICPSSISRATSLIERPERCASSIRSSRASAEISSSRRRGNRAGSRPSSTFKKWHRPTMQHRCLTYASSQGRSIGMGDPFACFGARGRPNQPSIQQGTSLRRWIKADESEQMDQNGEGGIRTHGRFPFKRFRVVRFRPLSHLSRPPRRKNRNAGPTRRPKAL